MYSCQPTSQSNTHFPVQETPDAPHPGILSSIATYICQQRGSQVLSRSRRLQCCLESLFAVAVFRRCFQWSFFSRRFQSLCSVAVFSNSFQPPFSVAFFSRRF